MWLKWAFPLISQSAVRAYYRLTVAGATVPRTGPVLLVGNHNHSLVDPAVMVIAARRPVRFLAKSPLFEMASLGWLVKGVGSVPVYRHIDTPDRVGENVDAFRDAHAALAAGDVVGIYPEGTSHTGSQLIALKTGAARIALGAAAKLGHAFPIVPVGLIIPDRLAVRSEALALVGPAVPWDDLATRGLEDAAAVRALTARIADAIRAVTLNLPQGEDDPIVRAAEQVWRAEFGAAPGVEAERARWQRAADALEAHRAAGGEAWHAVRDALTEHIAAVRALGLTPVQLHERVPLTTAAAWSLARLPLVLALPVSAIAWVWSVIPTTIAFRIADGMTRRDGYDAFATHRILVGWATFLVWIPLMAVVVGAMGGAGWGVASLLLQPAIGALAIALSDRRRDAVAAIRRAWLRVRAADRLAALRARQRTLAAQLQTLFDAVAPSA